MQITICGGGNAAHALAGLVAARQDCVVNVYAPFADEARRWWQGITSRGGITVVTPDGVLTGRPARISADPAEVAPGSRLVLLAVPAFAHEVTLRDIARYVDDSAWIGALPARGGFDWCVEDVLCGGAEEHRSREGFSFAPPLLRTSSFFGLQTLPWACRIQQYGQEVTILGAKAQVDLAVWPPSGAGELSSLLGDLLAVYLRPIPSFLGLTLANTGQLIHPGVMYGLFRDWDGRSYSEAPLFYQGIDAATAGILQQLSDEVQGLCTILSRHFPDIDLSAVRPLDEWLRRSYEDTIADASSLRRCFVTNSSYAGLRAPMRPTDGGLVPDFQARYLAEDVPYGLIVTRGIAELAGVATPAMDRVIMWAQKCLGKEYLIEGKLQGRDVASSRAPQRYEFESLDDVKRQTEKVAHHYGPLPQLWGRGARSPPLPGLGKGG